MRKHTLPLPLPSILPVACHARHKRPVFSEHNGDRIASEHLPEPVHRWGSICCDTTDAGILLFHASLSLHAFWS